MLNMIGPPRRRLDASSMLTAAYCMLRDGAEYHDLGPQHFVQRDKEQVTKRLLQRQRPRTHCSAFHDNVGRSQTGGELKRNSFGLD